MKKMILTLAMVLITLCASANSVRYFTRSQAVRVANTLDAQPELMIYCGYEYELATYVIINEVWMEPVNSKYYEIWLFGYDAYTGEEIYMPIDLSCIWLFNAYGNRMYSAAQYLRFRSTVATPNFYWTMPPYNPFVRHYHDPAFGHCYTYHYNVHKYGWCPPTGSQHNATYHPYYMRTPSTPAPVPSKPFTPGVNYPSTSDGHSYVGSSSRNTDGTRGTAFSNNGGERSGDLRNNNGNTGTTSRNSSSTNTGTTSRSNSSSTNTGTTSRGNSSSTNTGTSTSRGSSSSTNTGTSTSRGNSSSTNTGTSTSRGNSSSTNTGTSTSRGNSSSTNSGTTSRGNSSSTNTGTSTSRSNSSSTNTGTTTSRSSNTKGTTSSNTNSRSGSTNSGSRNSRN